MNIVIDANILFSALIKDSKTREIILSYDGYFLFPSYIFVELEKHKGLLLKKSKMNTGDFERLLSLILRKVLIVPTESLLNFREEANKIVSQIDPDDAIFFATSLANKPSFIWTDDKKLKNQNKVAILNTSEMINYLKK